MTKQEFNAVIQKFPNMDAAFVELPFEPEKVFGKKRVRVKVCFDGIQYRGTLMRMGMSCDWIGVTQDIRKKTGRNPGDTVHVVIEEDIEKRVITLPEDLEELFKKNKQESDFFHNLAFTDQKEYVNWILDAKREETRQKRLKKTIEMLTIKKKNPSEKK